MLHFKCPSDLSRLPRGHPAYPLIREAMGTFRHPAYCPEDEGWVVLIEPEDLHRPVWGERFLQDIPWEAVELHDGYFKAVLIPNNDFALVAFIPDAPWIEGTVRASIEAR